jgi:hypothetical protein
LPRSAALARLLSSCDAILAVDVLSVKRHRY